MAERGDVAREDVVHGDVVHGDVMQGDEGGAAGIEAYPEWLQKRLEWFQDLKFGLFLHWGVYCQWDCCESWPLVPEDTWARNDRMKYWTERGKEG